MAYQALYRAWRPDRFADVVGQEPIITTLVHQIESGRIAHAYLFCGSRGTGKTTTAKVLARAVNCAHPLPGAEPCGECEACVSLAMENSMDIMEIDAASNNSVDNIRELRDKIVYPPTVGKYKVYIIDEVHMLSPGAFNALLKTLEEPPAHAVFILATTEPQKLPATILSRCQRFDFKRISSSVIIDRLKVVLRGIGRQADDEALEVIARAAEGGMRDALSLTDMCLAYEDGRLSASLVREVLGASDRSFLFHFVQALLDGKADSALKDIALMVQQGRDPAVFLKEVVSHLRALMLSQMVEKDLENLLEVTKEDAERYREQGKGAAQQAIMRRMDLFMAAEADVKWASQPRTVIELAAVRACHPEREAGDDALMERLSKLEKAVSEGTVAAASEPHTPAEKKTPVKKPAAPKDKPAKQPAQDAVADEDRQMWQKVLEILHETDIATYMPLQQGTFAGIEGNTLSVRFPREKNMFVSMFQKKGKIPVLEEAAAKAFGKPMTVRVFAEDEGAGAKAVSGQARQNLNQVYDAFGRENVIIVDD